MVPVGIMIVKVGTIIRLVDEDYKEWLKLTKTCQICSTIASLIFPQTKQPDFLPDDYVLIGYVVGDGEVLCFSKSTGKYIRYFEGKVDKEIDCDTQKWIMDRILEEKFDTGFKIIVNGSNCSKKMRE